MLASYARHNLHFRFTARTSRGSMTHKETWFLRLESESSEVSVGECGVFRGLSSDDVPDYGDRLAALCRAINRGEHYDVSDMSSILFGLEQALGGLSHGGGQVIAPSALTSGKMTLPINGLVWMDTVERMSETARLKIADGFDTVKIKIGAYDFDDEYHMLDRLRREFGPEVLTLRLDANGAFSPDDAPGKLRRLSLLDIHSIEQPIAAGQHEAMASICSVSPVAVALDEDLIGITPDAEMDNMLRHINPAYIIVKPTLCGGLSGAVRWVAAARRSGIGWWPTSALESNVGLDAIAQFTAVMQPDVCSGLGTGALYHNNIDSPLELIHGRLGRMPGREFDFSQIVWTTPA